MRRALWALLLSACTGGQTGVPASGPPIIGSSDECPSTLDSPTALGLTSADLLALYGGTFTVDLLRVRDANQVLAKAAIEVRIVQGEPTLEALRCDQVAVDVTVSLHGQGLDLTAPAILAGTDEVALVQLTPATRDAPSGSIRFDEDRVSVDIDAAGFRWTTRVP